MTALQLFQQLNNRTVSRSEIEHIIEQAKSENQINIIYRLSKILNAYPKVTYFEVQLEEYPEIFALGAARHTGNYKEALDECGRLKKGWKFEKGNVVRVETNVKKTQKSLNIKSDKEVKEEKAKSRVEILKEYVSNNGIIRLVEADILELLQISKKIIFGTIVSGGVILIDKKTLHIQKMTSKYSWSKEDEEIYNDVCKLTRLEINAYKPNAKESEAIKEKRELLFRRLSNFVAKEEKITIVKKDEKVKQSADCKTCEKNDKPKNFKKRNIEDKKVNNDALEQKTAQQENVIIAQRSFKYKDLRFYLEYYLDSDGKRIVKTAIYTEKEEPVYTDEKDITYKNVYDDIAPITTEYKAIAKKYLVDLYNFNENFYRNSEALFTKINVTVRDFLEDIKRVEKELSKKTKKDLNIKSIQKQLEISSLFSTNKKTTLNAPQLEIDTEAFKKMSVSELRKFTFDYYLKNFRGKKLKIKDFIIIEFFNKAGKKLQKPMYSEKAAVIEHLENLIKNSTYNNWGNRKKTDSPDILGYLNFKSKLTIDGEKRHVRISVILDRERKTKFKTFEVGSKPKKKSRTTSMQPPWVSCSREVVQLSECKDTKENSKVKDFNTKEGLNAPFPEVFVDEVPENNAFEPDFEPEPIQPIVTKSNNLANMLSNIPQWESYKIARYDMRQFLGDLEKKNTDSLVITLTGGQGSGKTRFAFQFMNDFAQNYTIGHASMEEHPQSRLYQEKAFEYLNQRAMQHIEAKDVRSLSDLEKLIQSNDVIVIDSFQKLKEIDAKFEIDKDLRKKYNGKLFLVIFQQTTDGKMRGGSKSQFDGDIILFTEKFTDYRNNYVYPDKNRYNSVPACELKYNIFSQKLEDVQSEVLQENTTFDVYI